MANISQTNLRRCNNKVQENKDKAKVFLTLMEKHIMEKNLPIL